MRPILQTSILLLLPLAAFGGGFQLNEHGARAVGQGGAWVARAYDPSAIYFNPAGLAFQRGTFVSLGTTFIAPRAKYYGIGTGQLNMNNQVFTPINGYITSSLSDDLVVGIGVMNPYGLGTEWPTAWTGRYITTKADLISFFVTPTVSYKVTDDLSVGVGVNYVTGSAKLSRIISDPFAQQEHTATVDASGTGWGFNIGLLYRPTEDLSVGASYRSGVTIDATGSATFKPGLSVFPAGDVTATLNLPATGYIGVAYAVSENLEVEFDYQYVGWSSYDSLTVVFKADPSLPGDPKLFEDTYILRWGAEYTMDRLQLRLGYFFDNNPVKDRYLEPTLPDVDRHGFNAGAGYAVSQNISLDVFFMYLKGVQRTVSGTYVGLDGTYSTTATLFGVNLTYGF